jgi:lipid-A-disaccharide synthase
MHDPSHFKLFIVTGDPSGDVHAAAVVRALRRQQPAITLEAIGGTALLAEDVPLFENQKKMAQVGLGALWSAPYHAMLGWRLVNYLKHYKPDAVLLIDYGGFNLRLAEQLKKRGFKVLYYIPPQIWASRKRRLKNIQRWVDHVFCIFPFEQKLYEEAGVPVRYVGHPLVSQLPPAVSKQVFCQQHGLNPEQPLVGIFPGSRNMELELLLPPLCKAIPLIQQSGLSQGFSPIQFVVAQAASFTNQQFEQAWNKAAPFLQSHVVHRVVGENHPLLSACDMAIVKSGTVTLEAALYKRPMMIIYKGPWLLYLLAKWLVYLPYLGLPNILFGDKKNPLVPEVLQYDLTPTTIARHVLDLLTPTSANRQRQLEGFIQIEAMFPETTAAELVANGILEKCSKSKK